MMHACKNGDDSMVQALIAVGAEMESRDRRGWTPLIYAAHMGHIKATRVLLSYQEDVNKETADLSGNTPLLHAAAQGWLGVATLLVDDRDPMGVGASTSAQNKCGNTALHVATEAGQFEMVQLLLRPMYKASVEARNHAGNTSLICAARQGHTRILQALLFAGANVYAKDKYGSDALTFATHAGHQRICTILELEQTRQKSTHLKQKREVHEKRRQNMLKKQEQRMRKREAKKVLGGLGVLGALRITSSSS